MKITDLIWAALMTATVCLADHHKLSHDLRGVDPESNVDVIVQFKGTLTGQQHEALARRGALLKADLPSIKAGAYTVRAAALESLADDADVVFIAPDLPVSATTFNGGPDWATATVLGLNSSFASLPYDGAGIGVAILDSGINGVDDLINAQGKSSVVLYKSFVPGDDSTADRYGHGTHVAGSLPGNGAASSSKRAT